jgi:hypothetical protein
MAPMVTEQREGNRELPPEKSKPTAEKTMIPG